MPQPRQERHGEQPASLVEVRSRCRVCGSSALTPVFSLGEQFIAGAFFKKNEPIDPPFLRRYPLELMRCDVGRDPRACGLLQLRHMLARELLFKHYGYRSGINQTMRDNLQEIACRAEQIARLAPGDTVLDIGCNDGTLLLAYETEGLDKLGIDPAADVTQYARARGLEVISDFFSRATYEGSRPGTSARIVTSIAMFYDLANPAGFVQDVAGVLAPDGVWVMELSWGVSMLRKNAFDTICHEHLEYYTLRQIEWMLDRAGLVLHDVETNDINGGSFRLFIRPPSAGPVPAANLGRIERIREAETELRLDTDAPYEQFRARSEAIRRDLLSLLCTLQAEGRSVFIYGASTKGNVILQYCGIDGSVVAAAADRNPDKWGTRMLGSDVPIISEEEARAQHPDYFLVLPYHFIDEFIRRETDFLARGGKFILPIPEVRVIGTQTSQTGSQ